MSASDSARRSLPGSAPGGRITTQNPALLDMLREKTLERETKPQQDSQVTRFYVESPIFTKEDEENIKFVNTDVEEELHDSLDENEPDSVNGMPSVDDLVHKTVSLKSRQNTNNTQFSDSRQYKFDSSRFEDIEKGNADMPPPPPAAARKAPKGPEGTWDALQRGYDKGHSQREMNTDESHTVVPPYSSQQGKAKSRIITPIDNPLTPVSKQQTEEMRLLEEEVIYQQQLQQRVLDGTRDAESVHIPKLNLDEVNMLLFIVYQTHEGKIYMFLFAIHLYLKHV